MTIETSPFLFLIPLRPRATSSDWDNVVTNLQRTIRSIFFSAQSDVHVVLAAHDVPQIDELNDQRVTFVPAPFEPELEKKRGLRDKQSKLRLAAATLRSRSAQARYVMILDADDLVHKELASFVLRDDNRSGYIIRDGYRVDLSTRSMSAQFASFDKSCGSCAIAHFTPDDLPEAHDDRSSYFEGFLRHTESARIAAEAGRALATVPFLAAVYITNHADSLRMIRAEGAERRLPSKMIVRGDRAIEILAEQFGIAESGLVDPITSDID